MENTKKCKVYIWDEYVGELALMNNKIYFKYDTNFNLEISPLHLKNTCSSFCFSNLNYQYSLAGLYADSLPDNFGMKIIDKYFKVKYPKFKPNILDKLLFIGDVSLGALRYTSVDKDKHLSRPLIIELEDIRSIKKDILESNIPINENIELYKAFSPIGGAREKILLNYNSTHQTFSIGKNLNNDIPIILKLDESSEPNNAKEAIIEWIYAQTAYKAGLTIPKTYLFRDKKGYSHFATERFDTDRYDNRVHIHSLAGLIHENKSYRIDLYSFLKIAKNSLYLNHLELEEIFRRTVFNYIYNNHDDHLKNHEFMMDKNGQWSLSPVFDITFNNKIAQRSMRMTVNNKDSNNLVLKDFEIVAKKFEISNYLDIIKEVESTIPFFKNLVNKNIPSKFDYDIELYLDTKVLTN